MSRRLARRRISMPNSDGPLLHQLLTLYAAELRATAGTLADTATDSTDTSIAGYSARNRGRESHGDQLRRFGDLALFAYTNRWRSNCRCNISALAQSWKIMHGCA
jgi:hypothetical protein